MKNHNVLEKARFQIDGIMMLRFTLSKFQSFLLMPGFMKKDTITQQYNYNTTFKGADHKGANPCEICF